MNVRLYKTEDHDEVKALLKELQFDYFPEKDDLGGRGWVVEDGGGIAGFAWALVSEDSDTAVVEYLAVKKEFRKQGKVAMSLMNELLLDLYEMGKKRIAGLLPWDEDFKALLRLYKIMGLSARAGVQLSGSVETVAVHLQSALARIA